MSNLYKNVYTYTKSRWLELCHKEEVQNCASIEPKTQHGFGNCFDRIDATKLLITSTKIIYYD